MQWVQSANESQRRWTMQCGDTKSFFGIWRSVKRRELYKSDAAIFQCIEKMSNDIDISVPVHHHVDGTVLVVLKKVFLETMRIVVGFNAEPADAAPSAAVDYRKLNLLELIRTHCEFVIVNRRSHFDVAELKEMLSIAQRMTGKQKCGFLTNRTCPNRTCCSPAKGARAGRKP